MTEQAGHINQPDLITECAEAVAEWHYAYVDDCPTSMRMCVGMVEEVLKIMRKRGLITEQGLELIKQSGDAK